MEKNVEQKIKPEEQKRHLIKAYLDDEEYEKFQLFAKACNCTNSNFVRELLAGATLIEFPPKDYWEIKNQLNRVAINVNQIARIANSEGYINVDEYRQQASLLMKIAAEMSMFVSYCGAQLNPRLYEPSPFLTELLRKYDVEEMLNRVLDVLKDKHTTWLYAELPKINKEVLREKIIAILRKKHAGIDIPDDEIEAIADVLLPGVIKFFSSDEWRAELEAWRKEQELLSKKKEDKNGVA